MLKIDDKIQIRNARSRSSILKNIRNATEGKTAKKIQPFSVSYVSGIEPSLKKEFISHLEELNGEIILADSRKDLIPLISDLIDKESVQNVICLEESLKLSLERNGFPDILGSTLSESTEMVISGCEYLVANLGAIVVSSAQAGSRRMFCYPPVHVVIADLSQMVGTLDEAYTLLLEKYKNRLPSMISIIAGPSRTADIEKTLVLGAHGPKRIVICLIEASESRDLEPLKDLEF
jgi:L-lactate dehydrogenase complex protein LldG